ncbi:hypothetical protein ACFTQ7_22480 [Lysinibacillus sp. NPDC056959]|uniref:hypothetical protein n=1 Tax=Lysinibacillus sp. NPDC056959 TaxID=3345981 RepID=UPI00362B55B9
MKIQADVLDKELKKVLDAEGYYFYNYSDETAILVDDRGFEKELNPVFEIVSGYGDVSRLAAKLLFVRNIENEYSTDIGSIKKEDIFNFRINLKIKLIGMLNAKIEN